MSEPTWHDLPPANFRHGTLNGYTTHHCRCPPCTAASSEYQRSRRTRVPVGEHRVTTSAHGTINRYQKGCHCEFCREANTARHRRSMEQAANRPTPDGVHGTATGYGYWHCRCEKCVAFNSAASKAYKARRKAAEQ